MVKEKIPQTNGNAEGESGQIGFIWREPDIVQTRQSERSGILREQASQQTHDIVEMLFGAGPTSQMMARGINSIVYCIC